MLFLYLIRESIVENCIGNVIIKSINFKENIPKASNCVKAAIQLWSEYNKYL